ncbi:HU domain-containing protein [Flavobacterium agrisoli]|uniref:SPOR domain-containing protein n=1 Tax=Flavobacterium agrisoli TaxID=2793066 RepID=A0A934PMN3_9FLAO|nr:SPOR domain-containing protein [Flavobacterium agrisoli]MBK0369650.1 SPOR domain-containing protein [Flavobacterium agrisoli]
MKIEVYISQLLYRYQCVTVPGFGAFLTEIQSAQLHESSNSFFPPKKTISFNAHLKNNDGLLAHHIAQAEKTSYDYAVSAIGFEILNWKKTIAESGVLNLKNIGSISLNADAQMVFTPVEQNNYLTTSFGLHSFVSPVVKRESFEQHLETLEANTTEQEVISLLEDTPKRSYSYLKYAAIFVLGLTVAGSIGYPMYQNQIATQRAVVEHAVQKQVQNKIQEATFFIQNPMPAVTLTVAEKAEKKSYHIVAGAFRSEQGAQKLYRMLLNDGYKNAQCIGKNKYGLYPVLYGSYATMQEAEKVQREIHKAQNPEAWILIESL